MVSPDWSPTTDGRLDRLWGIDVVESDVIAVGNALLIPGPGGKPQLIKGVRPRTLIEDVRYEARLTVRHGIAAAHPWLRLP